jgi:hypothetical protein
MEKINGLIIIFLLAFALSTFVFVVGLFRKEQREEVNKYEVKIKEIHIRN